MMKFMHGPQIKQGENYITFVHTAQTKTAAINMKFIKNEMK